MEKDASGSFPSSRANLSLFSAKEPEASFSLFGGKHRLPYPHSLCQAGRRRGSPVVLSINENTRFV